MAKHSTPLLHRASPRAPRTHKAVRFTTHAPFLARNNAPRSPGLRSRLHSTNTNRFLASRSELSTIREEPDEDELALERGFDESREAYRPPDSSAHEHARSGSSRRQELDEDVDMGDWDDESTLVAMFQDSASEADEEEELLSLVEGLKGPMAAQGASLKQYLKDTLLPAYNDIKATHAELEDKVDLEFGAGLLTFDEVCKKVERVALRDEDELKTAHAESQRNIAHTLEELERAYGRRQELWRALDDDLDRCATRASSALEALSVDVEQTIAVLEKKSKALDKESTTSANQKMLRGLLEKL
ncbi:hypothetical protein C8Q80DRAFT_1173074 [Daedaleopsis nitida]|nr:hypothetical protein C8Q80DRAFT_1173074 [Daedaleopsis nitida]